MPHTEIMLMIKDSFPGMWITNLCYACEIGIGETKKEAVSNYGRFRKEKIDGAYTNDKVGFECAKEKGLINWKFTT